MKKSFFISMAFVVVMAFGFAHAESKGGAAKSNNRAVSKSSPKASSYNTVWKPVDNTRPLPKAPNTEHQKREANFKQKLNDPKYQEQLNELRQRALQQQERAAQWPPPRSSGNASGSTLPDLAPNATKFIHGAEAFGRAVIGTIDGAIPGLLPPRTTPNSTRHGR